MKKEILFLLLSLSPVFLNAQNLVPNESFEEYDNCPNSYSEINKSIGWNSFYETPDYYNSCCKSGVVGVPNNAGGFQNAFKGNAYAGLYSYAEDAGKNSREFIGAELNSPLSIGQKYYGCFKVNLADNSKCATNNIGVLLSVNKINYKYPLALNNHATFFSSSIISDTKNWITIAGSFIADSAYKYIILGNFFTDNMTNKLILNGNTCMSYYFIDDINISLDSASCNTIIDNTNKTSINQFSISPNPADKKIFINSGSIVSYSLNSILGSIIQSGTTYEKSWIDVSQIQSGIYFLKVQFNNSIIQQKLIIVH